MRLRAARAVLELGLRIDELQEIEKRLARLEAAFSNIAGRPGEILGGQNGSEKSFGNRIERSKN